MRIADLSWLQLERYLERDDRIVVPLGSTEQHAHLSLATDTILSERVSVEAAEPLGVPVLPSLPYGLAPYFAAYPGSPTLRPETYRAIVRDLLGSLHGQGFRRILLVNGHGGNSPGRDETEAWQAERPDARTLWHDWWRGPRVRDVVQAIDAEATHASWYENFPWTRLPDVPRPTDRKPLVDASRLDELEPGEVRELLGDGSFGGLYERPDEDVLRIWRTGVEEVRELLEQGWGTTGRAAV